MVRAVAVQRRRDVTQALEQGEVADDLRGSVEVDCEFCNRHYRFDAVDVEQVFAAEVVTRARSTRH